MVGGSRVTCCQTVVLATIPMRAPACPPMALITAPVLGCCWICCSQLATWRSSRRTAPPLQLPSDCSFPLTSILAPTPLPTLRAPPPPHPDEPKEIKALYKRFRRLDRSGRGTLCNDDLQMIPEIAMNPLSSRLQSLFDKDGEDRINFKSFVKALAIFSERSRPELKSRGACEAEEGSDPGCSNPQLVQPAAPRWRLDCRNCPPPHHCPPPHPSSPRCRHPCSCLPPV